MARHHQKTATRQLNPHMRRRLSEEGRRLLRHALAHGDDDAGSAMNKMGGGAPSLDLSVVENRDDASDNSDLESFTEWQQPPVETTSVSGTNGKKKKTRGHKLKDQYGDDDDANGDHDELERAMEQLSEKRDTTKIQALHKILTVLGSTVLSERQYSTAMELASQALLTLKKRSKESSALSLRVLSVVAITLGLDQQEFYDLVRQPLQRLVNDASSESSLRLEAAYTLSIASYVCCREDQQRWQWLDALGVLLVAARDADDNGDVEDEFSEELLVGIMECWAFVVSGFHPSTVVPAIRDQDAELFEHVEALAGFVREGMNTAIRSAACETLALLVQYKYIVGKSLWDYTMEDTTSPLGGLESKIERYMRESAKSVGKKTRKTQRSMLKDVLETLRTGDGPHQDLQIDSETLSVSTWSRFFQANVFRRALQSGFQVHLHANAVLRDVFDVAENANAKMSMVSTVRRRADHRSKAVNLRNDVSRKNAAQNAFLYDE